MLAGAKVSEDPSAGILAKIGQRLYSRPFESLCDSFFVFYSIWTLTWILAYSVNVPLSFISPVFLILFPLSLLALAFRPPDQRTLRDASHVPDTLVLLAFVIAGVLLTLFLHRPDADDEQYLGMAFSLLSNPNQPIQGLPGYGSGPYDNALYGIDAYDPFKAMVSYTTGLPLLVSYYLLVPALMSALTVVVTSRLLRLLIPEGWIAGMLFFFIVMLAWGDVHRTLANFGFVRMFQGKSVLVSAIVPALFLYFLLLKDKLRSKYHIFLLAAALISGVGFSRGGLIIGPLVLLFLAVASLELKTLTKPSKILLSAMGISAAIILPLAYYNGWTLMNPSQLVHTSRGDVESTTNLEILQYNMGFGFRGFFLLACVGVSFLFIKDKAVRYTYANFLTIFFFLLLIPWTSNFFGKTIQIYLSWRWLWITPVPVLASVAVGGALAKIRQNSNFAAALGVFLVLAVGFSAASPRRVVSTANYTSVRWPNAKLDGDSIYLRAYGKTAEVRDGRLYMECEARASMHCHEMGF